MINIHNISNWINQEILSFIICQTSEEIATKKILIQQKIAIFFHLQEFQCRENKKSEIFTANWNLFCKWWRDNWKKSISSSRKTWRMWITAVYGASLNVSVGHGWWWKKREEKKSFFSHTTTKTCECTY